MDRATDSQLKFLSKYFGDPNLSEDQVRQIQEIIIDTGAQSHIESMIEQLAQSAQTALTFEGVSPVGKELLTQLVNLATKRKI